MHSLPAKQLQQIKKELGGEATIRMSRKSLMYIALDKADKANVVDLKENKAIQPAFIFSESNPFTLYKLIQERKSSAPASGGEIAPNDIVIEEGDTGIGPGPMIGQLQQLGAQTQVSDGSIEVTESSVAVEAGEVIDGETAEILNKLGMKPLEVGLDLKLVHENGEVFDKDVLSIDEEAYQQDVEAGAVRAFNLAVNAGYLTAATAQPILAEQISKARNLAVNAEILDKEVIDDLLAKGADEARSLDTQIDQDAETPEANDESDDEASDD
jgi:large subunit ribosomal protein L10